MAAWKLAAFVWSNAEALVQRGVTAALLRIQPSDYELQVLIVLFYLSDFQVHKKYTIMPIALWYIFYVPENKYILQ